MRLVKVAAGTLNQTPGDWEGNKKNILEAIELAYQQNASILCLSELCISGYGAKDMFFAAKDMHDTSLEMLKEILPHTNGMVVALGLPLFFRKALFNTICLAVDGKIAGFVPKKHLAGDGIHYEPRWFHAWPENAATTIEIDGSNYPIGDIYFQLGDVSLGFEICEESFSADRTGRRAARKACDIILNPSASHFAFGKLDTRKTLVKDGARAFNATYVYSNLVGNEAGDTIYDGGAIIASAGEVLVGKRFSFKDIEVTATVVDLDLTRTTQSRIHSYKPDFSEDGVQPVNVRYTVPEASFETGQIQLAAWESSKHFKEGEFVRAISLGLFDYLRKSKLSGFALSLSGGADSGLVACLVWSMVKLAVKELGVEGFKCKLAHISALAECTTEAQLVKKLLFAAYQKTVNSSQTTEAAARGVAEAVGARFAIWDVQSLVDQYEKFAIEFLGRPLNWQSDTVARENIQSRVRLPSISFIANLENLLVLNTTNRDESGLGHGTIWGCMGGGLGVVAGADKPFILQVLRLMQTEGVCELPPLPVLSLITAQQPTAELQPPEMKQTDEKQLGPYPVLNAIATEKIQHNRSPLDAYRAVRQQFPQYYPHQIGEWVESYFKRFSYNQFKRISLPTALHVDNRNVDPRAYQGPVLSGGFKRELKAMWLQVHEDACANPGNCCRAGDIR